MNGVEMPNFLNHRQNYLALIPAVRQSPGGCLGAAYDAEGDVLYVHFKPPGAAATDSELTDDDIILRYDGAEVIGIAILHASQR